MTQLVNLFNAVITSNMTLQEAADVMADMFNLPHADVFYGRKWFTILDSEPSEGEYDAWSHPGHYIIVLDDENKTTKDVAYSLFHEFRHHWQYFHYTDLVMWWKNHPEQYRSFYFSKLASIEEDANIWSYTIGTQDATNYMDKYSKDVLEEALMMNTLMELAEEAGVTCYFERYSIMLI